jgi:hypothetical protein
VAERGREDEKERGRSHGRDYCMTGARQAVAPPLTQRLPSVAAGSSQVVDV